MIDDADGWDPFGRPLFDDPSARALSRVGVVDVGSNSVRMVVFDGAARSPAYFYNEKVMAGLGKGLAETGRLNPEGRARALSALRRFALLAEGMGIAPLTVVATAAVREAADGPAFAEALAGTADQYGRFNLLLWDGRSLHFCSNHPAFVAHAVSPGIHAMSNGAFDAPWPKAGAATQRLQAWLAAEDHAGPAGQADTAPLFEALADTTVADPDLLPDTGVGHTLERFLSPVFILGQDYGTRSSTVLLAGPEGIDFEERRFGPVGAALGGNRVRLGR